MNAPRALTPYLGCFDAAETPVLSAETYVIYGRAHTYLFDCGHGTPAPETLALLSPRFIFLSHFHADHTGNLPSLPAGGVLGSAYTVKRTGGTVPAFPFMLEDGVALRFEPLPSSHVSGACMLTLEGEVTLLGDGIYPGPKGYNVSVLKQTIDALQAADTRYFICSHRPERIEKQTLLRFLRTVYDSRKKGQTYIKTE